MALSAAAQCKLMSGCGVTLYGFGGFPLLWSPCVRQCAFNEPLFIIFRIMAEETKFHDSGVMEVSMGPVPVDSSSVNDLDCHPRQPEQPSIQGVGPDGVGQELDSKYTDAYADLDDIRDHNYSPKQLQASTNPVCVGGAPQHC